MRWTIPLRISRRISNCADDVRFFFWDLRQSHAHTTNRPTGYPLDREHLAVEINAVAGAPVRIVIGVDGSPDANNCFHAAAQRSWPKGSEGRVVVVPKPGPRIDMFAATVSQGY